MYRKSIKEINKAVIWNMISEDQPTSREITKRYKEAIFDIIFINDYKNLSIKEKIIALERMSFFTNKLVQIHTEGAKLIIDLYFCEILTKLKDIPINYNDGFFYEMSIFRNVAKFTKNLMETNKFLVLRYIKENKAWHIFDILIDKMKIDWVRGIFINLLTASMNDDPLSNIAVQEILEKSRPIDKIMQKLLETKHETYAKALLGITEFSYDSPIYRDELSKLMTPAFLTDLIILARESTSIFFYQPIFALLIKLLLLWQKSVGESAEWFVQLIDWFDVARPGNLFGVDPLKTSSKDRSALYSQIQEIPKLAFVLNMLYSILYVSYREIAPKIQEIKIIDLLVFLIKKYPKNTSLHFHVTHFFWIYIFENKNKAREYAIDALLNKELVKLLIEEGKRNKIAMCTPYRNGTALIAHTHVLTDYILEEQERLFLDLIGEDERHRRKEYRKRHMEEIRGRYSKKELGLIDSTHKDYSLFLRMASINTEEWKFYVDTSFSIAKNRDNIKIGKMGQRDLVFLYMEDINGYDQFARYFCQKVVEKIPGSFVETRLDFRDVITEDDIRHFIFIAREGLNAPDNK